MSAELGNSTPDRLVAAAISILYDTGLAGLSHRAVARRAGVSLGSTTYHFGTIEDLRAAAIASVVESFRRRFDAWYEEVKTIHPADAVTSLLTVDDVPALARNYELYVAAVSDSGMRSYGVAWSDYFIELLRRFAPNAGEVLSTLLDGYFLRVVLVGGADPTFKELTAISIRSLIETFDAGDGVHSEPPGRPSPRVITW